MSNRNLTHYFSPNTVKPILSAESDTNSQECMTPVTEKAFKKGKPRAAKLTVLNPDDDDDFENDPILPPQNGNAITKYFSPVDRSTIASKRKKAAKPSVMTVEAQVHDSTAKQNGHIILKFKRVPKKIKKKKTGIPEALADKIEVVSSEEVRLPPSPVEEAVSDPSQAEKATIATSQTEVAPASLELPKDNPIKKRKWQLRLRLDDSINSSDGDFEESQNLKDGPRRSVRLRNKPPPAPTPEPVIEEPKVTVKKKRKKDLKCGDDEDDIEVLSEDVAPIFLKKQFQEEARAIKKAKQDFLFSGVPEVLKQQTTAQQKLEERPVEIFPKISHIMQAGSRPWNLPFPEKSLLSLIAPEKLKETEPLPPTAPFSSLALCLSAPEKPSQQLTSIQVPVLEWRDCKQVILKMKEDFSLSFPFFRTLRNLLPKSNRENFHNLSWTDAFAPKCSADFLATNRKPASQLKAWLNQWKLKAGEEVTISPKKPTRKSGKRKRIDSDGPELDDEAVLDERSNSSWSSEERLTTCMLLVGPSGCGKTATIYALAEELGFNVLEVNASSKRNGKTVLSQLHEATQSHSVSSATTPTSNTFRNFFTGAKAAHKALPKPEEKRTSMSLALFKDVDIVFETEDESFYGALSTLIQTSKRPIVMTLGTTEERALTLVQDKIKSFFDVILFSSPSIPTACGYLWSLALAKGYPLEWGSLQRWIAGQTDMDIDLRSLIFELQFLLQHHPLGLKLNFTQLQLRGEEESPSSEDVKLLCSEAKTSASKSVPQVKAGNLLFIELPHSEMLDELPMPSMGKPLKFLYDANEDSVVVGKKTKFHRIVDAESLEQSDQEGEGEKETSSHEISKWVGDLSPLTRLLDLRAGKDLLSEMRDSEDLSWNERSLLCEVEEFSAKKCNKLLEKEFNVGQFETDELRSQRLHNAESLRSANSILLNSSLSRAQILQRRAGASDVLPYLRSFLRSDLLNSIGKRRRKGTSQRGSSIRLPSLDLVLSTSTVMELANQF